MSERPAPQGPTSGQSYPPGPGMASRPTQGGAQQGAPQGRPQQGGSPQRPMAGRPVQKDPQGQQTQTRPAPARPAPVQQGAAPQGGAPQSAVPQSAVPQGKLPPAPAPEKPSLASRIQGKLQAAGREQRANSEGATPAVEGRTTSARRARLRLTRVDPWSVMKTAFLLSIAFGVVTFVAVLMVWTVLGAAGVWDSINSAVAAVVEGDNNKSSFDVTNYLGMSRVLGFTLLVSVVDVILLTAIATLGAFLYNLAAALLGGVEVTLAEEGR